MQTADLTSTVSQPFQCLDGELANVFLAYGTDAGIGGLPLFNVNGKAEHSIYRLVC